EQLVVGVAAHAVGAGVAKLHLADLPDRALAGVDDARHERVGGGVDSAGRALGRGGRGQAVERHWEAEVDGGRGVVAGEPVSAVGDADAAPLELRAHAAEARAGYLADLGEVGAGEAIARAGRA